MEEKSNFNHSTYKSILLTLKPWGEQSILRPAIGKKIIKRKQLDFTEIK